MFLPPRFTTTFQENIPKLGQEYQQSPAGERELVTTLQVLQETEFGLTKDLASIVICDYLKDQPVYPNPFQQGIPGRDW